ncbi:hypothetical protein [Hymenobacter pini]|uniref:hypothetical protein n=1 Tax=Hymenobacter pini TaxID=2880879 RepID=UPI001CF2FEC6|nr:hypothetical protein [Hymenobacter pini]MCA8830177.1 hypothetical protein [Hymenobacter pini]
MAKQESLVVPAKLETTFDRIYFSYLSDEVERTLTPQELERRARIDEAWHHMLQRKSPLKTAEYLQEKLGVSRATAYRIVQDALHVFGNLVQTTKAQKRLLLWEYSLRALDQAEALGDMRAFAAIQKNMIVFEGLNVEDKDSNLEALQAHTYLIELKGAGGPDAPGVRFNVEKIEELEEAQYAEVVEAVENMSIPLEDMEQLLDKAEKKGKPKK